MKILPVSYNDSIFKDFVHLTYKGNDKLVEHIFKAVKMVPKSAFSEKQDIPVPNISDPSQFPKLSVKRCAEDKCKERFPKFPRRAKDYSKFSLASSGRHIDDATVQHEVYQHPEQGHHLNTEDDVDLLPATVHADNAGTISKLKLQLETSKQTIISLQDELKKKDSDINVVTADVNKLKTAMVTLISEREADQKFVD